MNDFVLYLFCTCVSTPLHLFVCLPVSMRVIGILSVCLSFSVYVYVCPFSCQPRMSNVYLMSVCLIFFLHFFSSSLFSSKACHLVVDWAGERKITWLSIVSLIPVTCLLMNLGLFLYLAICGRDSNLDRFGED